MSDPAGVSALLGAMGAAADMEPAAPGTAAGAGALGPELGSVSSHAQRTENKRENWARLSPKRWKPARPEAFPRANRRWDSSAGIPPRLPSHWEL